MTIEFNQPKPSIVTPPTATRPKGENIVETKQGWWWIRERDCSERQSLHKFLILTKTPDCKRGQYAEELDVVAPTEGIAKRIANAVLKSMYEPCVKVSKICWRGPL